MLTSCHPKCKLKSTTDASLDIEKDQVVCNYCGDALEHLSSYAKKSLKINGDIVKKKKGLAYSFKCLACKSDKQVSVVNDKICGRDCLVTDNCNFNLSDYMIRTIKSIKPIGDEEGSNE